MPDGGCAKLFYPLEPPPAVIETPERACRSVGIYWGTLILAGFSCCYVEKSKLGADLRDGDKGG